MLARRSLAVHGNGVARWPDAAARRLDAKLPAVRAIEAIAPGDAPALLARFAGDEGVASAVRTVTQRARRASGLDGSS